MLAWLKKHGPVKIFRSSELIIPEEDHEWQVDTYRWLLSEFNSPERAARRVLVYPTRDFFPDVCNSAWERVNKTFARVAHYADMEKWECLLQPQEADPNAHVGPTLIVQGAPQGPAGTFRLNEDNKPVITFKPELANDPQGLVSTLSHELAHLLLSTASEPPPGGMDNLEVATDLAAVFLGFGIFLSNTSFRFSQFGGVGTIGWRVQRQGYLTGDELLHALAIFVRIFERDPKEPEEFIKSSSIRLYRRALRSLDTTDVIEQLKAVQYCLKSATSREALVSDLDTQSLAGSGFFESALDC